MKLLIKNGLVVDPKNNLEKICDVLVEDRKIKSVGENIDAAGEEAEVIDAKGLVVAPGLVDLHVHFRDPGYEYKEDIETGSRAASQGGVTSVVCMPNTNPVIDNAALVKYVIDKACMIHSVDSLRLAREISKEAVKHELDVPVLIEVNVAGEESKFGVSVEEAPSLVEEVSKLPGIQVNGLMTIAPYVEDPEENRYVFRNLRKLSVDIREKNFDNVTMNVLSMGMTGDYEVAIEEGATHVRVGTGIFGERNYNIEE